MRRLLWVEGLLCILRLLGGNPHYNSEGYVLLGKKTADVVEAFYKDNE